MKAFSYTCAAEEIKELRNTLISMGATILSQTTMTDIESPGTTSCFIRIVFVLDEASELIFKLTFPSSTFKDCSA